MKLLHIDSSPLGADSVSRELTRRTVAHGRPPTPAPRSSTSTWPWMRRATWTAIRSGSAWPWTPPR